MSHSQGLGKIGKKTHMWSSPTVSIPLCYNSLKGPEEIDILKNKILVYYDNDIMLIELDEQQMASVLEAWIRFMYSRW